MEIGFPTPIFLSWGLKFSVPGRLRQTWSEVHCLRKTKDPSLCEGFHFLILGFQWNYGGLFWSKEFEFYILADFLYVCTVKQDRRDSGHS